jgi:hypothetical protein
MPRFKHARRRPGLEDPGETELIALAAEQNRGRLTHRLTRLKAVQLENLRHKSVRDESGKRAVAARARMRGRLSSPVLVGRTDELASVLRAVSNPPALIVVEGEAGVGKTRLVEELLDAPELEASGRYVGDCQSLVEPFPLGPALKRLPSVSSGATDPAWSPNGRWIAFVGAVAPERVYLMSVGSHHVHALASHSGAKVTGQGIAWSPDSSRLVYNAPGKLTAFNLETRTFHVLLADGESPSWSPDGQWIVFCYGDYVKEIRSDGTGLRHILYVTSNKGQNFAPDWGH